MFLKAPESTLYYKYRNQRAYGTITRPTSVRIALGTKKLITKAIGKQLVDRITYTNNVQQDELIFNLFIEFNVAIS